MFHTYHFSKVSTIHHLACSQLRSDKFLLNSCYVHVCINCTLVSLNNLLHVNMITLTSKNWSEPKCIYK